jgi:hypothetical protein
VPGQPTIAAFYLRQKAFANYTEPFNGFKPGEPRMKTWGVVCALLSGAIFAAMLASMHSCSRSYEVDAQGRLCKVEEDASISPPTVRRAVVPWSTSPPLQSLERWVQPGDRLESTDTTGGLWLELRMAKVEVFRGEETVMIVREGHLRFWGITLAVSLFPMICWGIGAFWTGTLALQGHPEGEAHREDP